MWEPTFPFSLVKIKSLMGFFFSFTFMFFNFMNPCFMLNHEFLKLSYSSFVHFMIHEVWGVNFLCLILSFMSFVACESLRFGICEVLLFMNFVDVHHCFMLLLCHLLLLLLISVTSYYFAINYYWHQRTLKYMCYTLSFGFIPLVFSF
jgi:hypothetical protein